MKKTLSTRSLVNMAMFAAILCVSAYISIPLPSGYHITFLNFVVLLVGMMFPVGQSVTIVAIWLFLGAIGIPVFIGGSAGIGYLLSGLGGYSLSFILIALFLPLVCGKAYHRIRYTIYAMIASLMVDAVGALWLMTLTHITLKAALVTGFLPFLPLDILKSIVVAQIIPQFRRIVHTQDN